MRKRILATLAYYDVLDYPLSAKEILRYLINIDRLGVNTETRPEIRGVVGELNALVQEGIVGHREDYYFLYEREYLVPLRLQRKLLNKRKMIETTRITWWLSFIPYLRVIFASGSLSLGNTGELSDLDILIVSKHGRIWTTRALVKLVLSFLGVRRKSFASIAPDKICDNHYVTDKSLHISFHSLYTAELYANLLPIFVRDAQILARFRDANSWIRQYVNEWQMNGVKESMGLPIALARILERFFDMTVGTYIEESLKKYQIKRIEHSEKIKEPNTNGRITYTDKQLEFHPSSPEGRIIPRYNENLRKLGLGELAKETDSGLTS